MQVTSTSSTWVQSTSGRVVLEPLASLGRFVAPLSTDALEHDQGVLRLSSCLLAAPGVLAEVEAGAGQDGV